MAAFKGSLKISFVRDTVFLVQVSFLPAALQGGLFNLTKCVLRSRWLAHGSKVPRVRFEVPPWKVPPCIRVGWRVLMKSLPHIRVVTQGLLLREGLRHFWGNVLRRCLPPKGFLHRRGSGTPHRRFIAIDGLQHGSLTSLRDVLQDFWDWWASKSCLQGLRIHR